MEAQETVVSAEDTSRFRWYALQVLSNYEARAQKAIGNYARVARVDGFIGRIIFPIENICEIRNGKKVMRRRKLYPGYLFLELDLYDGKGELNHSLWQFMRSIQGVSGFVGTERPVALRQEEVDEVLAQAAAKQRTTVSKRFYEIGIPVKITEGPFAGSSGEIESINEEMGTLRVSVGLFGRKTPVDLEFWQVIKEEL
ncbi:MAG: transcription termination/antitermination protein NusG [Puniceicoccales bacterium]|jgi:transcriptional antiterminator NusG|nr:transcription termination/antitermination protein NusG [Puniceicoccales bacterium]